MNHHIYSQLEAIIHSDDLLDIIQVDAAHWWGWGETPPHVIVKRFGCTAIHNKSAL